MDIEKQPDDTFITIAGMYVDESPSNMRLFADLARNAKDIYALVFHPDYKKITEKYRSQSKISLDDVLNSCLRETNQNSSSKRITTAKKELLNKRINKLLSRVNHD